MEEATNCAFALGFDVQITIKHLIDKQTIDQKML